MQVRLRPGDTLWYYNQLFRVPLILLLESNRGQDPSSLQPGQNIQIPGYVAAPYTIRPGDAFWLIAKRQGLPLDALLLANPGVNPDLLYPGQSIRLPVRVTWRVAQAKKPYDFASLTADLQLIVGDISVSANAHHRPVGHGQSDPGSPGRTGSKAGACQCLVSRQRMD